MAQIETVIFDLGGVLIDWNPRYLYRKLLNDESAVEHFLATVCTQVWNEQQDAGRLIEHANEALVSEHPHHRDLIEAYYGRWEEMLGGPITGSVDLLDQMKLQQGVRLLALTNWSAETFPIALERYAFLGHFEDILVSGEVGLKKPDRAIFDMLLSRHSLVPESTVFIDDARHNITAAQAIGLNAIRFEHPDQLREDLDKLGVALPV